MKIDLAENKKEIIRLKEENNKISQKPNDIYGEGDTEGVWSR